MALSHSILQTEDLFNRISYFEAKFSVLQSLVPRVSCCQQGALFAWFERRQKGEWSDHICRVDMGWGDGGGKLDLAWHSMNKTIQMMLMKLLGIKQQTGFFLPLQVVQRSAPPLILPCSEI